MQEVENARNTNSEEDMKRQQASPKEYYSNLPQRRLCRIEGEAAGLETEMPIMQKFASVKTDIKKNYSLDLEV